MNASTPPRVELGFGDDLCGYAVALQGGLLLAVSPVAFAPGRPLQVRASIDGEQMQFGAKSLGSKRRADGSFDVRLRPVDLRRQQRTLLERALSA